MVALIARMDERLQGSYRCEERGLQVTWFALSTAHLASPEV
jgi:hypothetical protein